MTTDSYKVGVYLRLSRDDNNAQSESMSIGNQRDMLIDYVKEKGWSIEQVYSDDGYSGTNFDRPDFQRMIDDIKNGRINLVITKDLSRLGRNYVRVGEYTDFFFPQHKVRYIAVTENIDTDKENDIVGFLNIVNEHYAKDISRKVRAVKNSKAKQGKFLGSQPPFGYKKAPDDRNQLIIDEEAAAIVTEIFTLYSIGESARNIATILNDKQVLTPSVYYYERIKKPYPFSACSKQWGSATIMTMLKNIVYIVHMAQGKRRNTSFKMKYREVIPQENWIIVKNTHKEIINQDLWNKVQNRISNGKVIRKTSSNQVSTFSGVIRCADCGARMTFTTKKCATKIYDIYRCRTYANSGKGSCSNHSIHAEDLEQIVLEDINRYARKAIKDEDGLLKYIYATTQMEDAKSIDSYEKRLQKCQQQSERIDNLIRMLLEDKLAGNVSEQLFKRFVAGYENELETLRKRKLTLNSQIKKLQRKQNNAEGFVETIKNYVFLEELNNSIVRELIEAIFVSETIVTDGSKSQQVEIKYKFVGELDDFDTKERNYSKKVIDQTKISTIDNHQLSTEIAQSITVQ